jgi:chemotaxis protein histidine kinase CheA
MDPSALLAFLDQSEVALQTQDVDFVQLEAEPRNVSTINSILRAIHSIKGDSPFRSDPRPISSTRWPSAASASAVGAVCTRWYDSTGCSRSTPPIAPRARPSSCRSRSQAAVPAGLLVDQVLGVQQVVLREVAGIDSEPQL